MKTIHLSLSIRGALKNWSNRMFEGLFRDDDGRTLSASEAKDHLLEQLAQGHEVLPMSKDCIGFDFKEGCPGHESEAPSS